MRKKILYLATSDIHLQTFHIPYFRWFKDKGYLVHVVCENRGNFDLPYVDKIFYLPFKRSPFKKENIHALIRLKKIIDENEYDLIHSHTPVVSVLTRLAAIRARKKGTKVIYTAHGFHFFKGAPLKYWLLFFPIEYLLSFFTDAIIAINKEDYNRAKERLKCKNVFYMKGLGVDPSKFRTIRKEERTFYRKELGFSNNDFILIYIAEFIPRKNHKFIIDTISNLIQIVPNLKVIFLGKGILFERTKKYSQQLGVKNFIKFMGFRTDVNKFISISDVGISASFQEGLPINILEEMISGLPIVASNIRGHEDLVEHGRNGFLFEINDKESFMHYIVRLYKNEDLREEMGQYSILKAQDFTLTNSIKSMESIYNYLFI